MTKQARRKFNKQQRLKRAAKSKRNRNKTNTRFVGQHRYESGGLYFTVNTWATRA